MKWVTRERPKIDRIACPWLTTRFIGAASEFLYVPAADVLTAASETCAVPCGTPDVETNHVDELCPFDAFIATYQLANPVLQQPVALEA